jgi:hypothetical protein
VFALGLGTIMKTLPILTKALLLGAITFLPVACSVDDSYDPQLNCEGKCDSINQAVDPDVQEDTLNEILRRVEVVTEETGWPGVVQIDLDLTSLLPIERTQRALEELGLNDASTLEVLPGYSSEAYRAWARGPVGSDFPSLRNIGSLDRGAFWNQDLSTDEPNAGLAEFVKKVQDAGGTVVFNSGRFTEDMYAPSLEALESSGLDNINLVSEDWMKDIDPTRINLLIGNPGFSDAGVKKARQEAIWQLGDTVAVIDDRIRNRNAVIEGAKAEGVEGDIMSVAIAIPGFSFDPVALDQEFLISTFE